MIEENKLKLIIKILFILCCVSLIILLFISSQMDTTVKKTIEENCEMLGNFSVGDYYVYCEERGNHRYDLQYQEY